MHTVPYVKGLVLGILRMHTMGRILRHWRIIAATLFSAVLVYGSYVLARGFESPSSAEASTETALLQAIAAKDSDRDGLSDWEEVLYGTDPHVVDSRNLGMNDGEAVAKGLIVPKAVASVPAATSTQSDSGYQDEGTLTSAFAQDFFALYLRAKQSNGGSELTADQTSTLAGQIMGQLSQSIPSTVDFKTAADVIISGTGQGALRDFAVAAEAVFKKNAGSAATNEIQSLQSAVLDGDTSALAQLSATAQIYRNYAADLLKIPVPQELAGYDVALVNAMLLRAEVDDDLAQVNTDPLKTMLALEQFDQTERTFWDVFSGIGALYASSGVVLPAGAPGAAFVNLIGSSGATTP